MNDLAFLLYSGLLLVLGGCLGALLTLFLDFGWVAGYTTILIAHIAFEVSFIAMTVRARNSTIPPTIGRSSGRSSLMVSRVR